MTQNCAVFSLDVHDNYGTTRQDITSRTSAFEELSVEPNLLEVPAISTPGGPRCCRINRRLLWNKIFYAGFFAAIGAIIPYVSLLCKQHGLSPEQIGLITGAKPIVGFMAAPIFANLAERFRIRKWVLVVSVLSYLAFYVGLFQLPEAKRIDTCPDQVKSHREEGLGISDIQKRSLFNDSFPREQFIVSNGSDNQTGNDITLGGLFELNNALNARSTSNGTNDTSPDYDNERLLIENTSWIYDPDSLRVVFWAILVLIFCGEVFQAPTSSLSDASTLQTLGPSQLGRYGYQRAWGAIGFGLGSFMAGALVSSSRKKEVLCGVELYFSDYRLLTYVFIGFLVVAFVAATQIKFKEGEDDETIQLTDSCGKPHTLQTATPAEKEKSHNAKAVLKIFLNVHYGSWLATSFFVGVCNGVIWGFLYWHLDNLGADQLLMGVSGIVVCLSEFIMFFLVGRVIKLIGHIGIMYVGLIGYSVRFCIYAVIKNPWLVLPAEVLQGITFSIVWVSMTAYTTLAVPSASLATIQGILHGVYFGLGSGSGHLIGGLMIGYVGAVITFFTFAGASLVVLVLFAIAQSCSTKPEQAYDYTDPDDEVETTNTNIKTIDPDTTLSPGSGDITAADDKPSDVATDTLQY